MYKINCLNPIASVGLNLLTEDYEKVDNFAEADAVLVRSAAMHNTEMPEQLLAVARAGAGVNNIPLDVCADKGIVVFNTPGANANGVKELVIAAMLLASRDIAGGIEWVKSAKNEADIAKLAEKTKKNFAGSEIMGKTLGVIGLGAIGAKVANAALSLGMEVIGYDPFLSVTGALALSRRVQVVKTLDEIYAACDYITIHVPALKDTTGMINAESIAKMKDNVVIINLARDLLVNEGDMAEALKSGKVKKYVTDFPNPVSANMEGAIVIPHLGASTEESEDNCAVMAVKQLREYLENGNIVNSVNYPNCSNGICTHAGRVTILHKNIPNMLTQFTAAFAKDGVNISEMVNKSRGEYAYTILDYDSESPATIVEDLMKIDGVIKARVIK
ncbi:MAG: 3-phosphoglycerate dehydrogenase [Lachnospiraceae bacterium]|nr:3-phosphoglycerate dehydrogenase [Lachnospiraceae bacterium]